MRSRCFHRGRGGGPIRKRGKGRARARRDFTGRPAWHDRGRGNPDCARRSFITCGPGRAANGQSMCLRRDRHPNRLSKAHAERQRHDLEARRLHLDRRNRRRSFCRRSHNRAIGNCPGAGRSITGRKKEPHLPRVRKTNEVGGRVSHAWGAHKRGHTGASDKCGRIRRGRHRALPDRAHVFRRQSDRRDAGDDFGRHQKRAGPGAGQIAALSTRRFHRYFHRAKWVARDDSFSRSTAA